MRRLDGDVEVTAAGGIGPIQQTGPDVILGELRVLLQEIDARGTRREEVEDQRKPDPGPPDTGLPEAHARVDGNPGKKVFSVHDALLLQPTRLYQPRAHRW